MTKRTSLPPEKTTSDDADVIRALGWTVDARIDTPLGTAFVVLPPLSR